MQNISIGQVIKNKKTEQEVKVSRISRNAKYDIDGVPSIVDGHFVDNNVHVSISFSRISLNQQIEDWRDWEIVR